ncbi:MAG: outer membrane protein assembly factor BamA, partial [Verrucomicrobiae bacterium]|nr:outer membrane protein assembly factor BamA [Verrucomicrobiae bacterium]
GKPYSADVVEQDVKNLIATGYFYDVRVFRQDVPGGVRITFRVQGKATLKEVVFEGSTRYKDDRLRREVTQKPGDVLDHYKAHADALKIQELYNKAGYADARVEPKVTIDRDTGRAILRYVIFEGDRVLLKRIVLHGNKAVPTITHGWWHKTKGILNQIKTRHYWWGSWLSGTGIIKEDQLREDLEKIREIYHSLGYIDAEVRGTRVERISPKWAVLHIDIYEGTQYRVGNIKIEGAKLFPVADIQKRLKMTSGQIFTPDGLTKDTKAIEDFYGERGYLDTNVQSLRTPNIETGRIDITYNIQEGELNYIELISIRGNTRTKDKVIRRELAVAPGDVYNTVRVDRSMERLKNLGYFSKVESRPEPTGIPNRKNLIINVEEQRTGNVIFGAGFSTIDSLVGFVEVTQGNFDLFNPPTFTGGGQKMRVRAQVGLRRQDYLLSFTEPWFLDKQLAFGFDIFHQEAYYLSDYYDESRTGGALRLGKALNQFLRLDLQYSIQQIHESIGGNASQELKAESGNWLRSAIQASLTYDRRDSVFLTTRGQRHELVAELAGGPFGGDLSIYKIQGKTAWFFPFFDGHVLQLLAAGGVVDAYGSSRGRGPWVQEISGTKTNLVKVNDVPIFDRFFLGGANTLRGFHYRAVGPRDINNEPIGGNTFMHGTIEYSVPVVERIRFAVFFDIGEVEREAYSFNAENFKANVGAGIRLNLPIGPLRLDYGHPVITDSVTGRSGRIQFSVGYQF